MSPSIVYLKDLDTNPMRIVGSLIILETLPWHILSVLFSRKITCTFRTIVEVRGCCMSGIEFYSFLHIIKGKETI